VDSGSDSWTPPLTRIIAACFLLLPLSILDNPSCGNSLANKLKTLHSVCTPAALNFLKRKFLTRSCLLRKPQVASGGSNIGDSCMPAFTRLCGHPYADSCLFISTFLCAFFLCGNGPSGLKATQIASLTPRLKPSWH
jgi:hypothetical protein